MNELIERFRTDAYNIYFDALNKYRESLRKATSRLDKENQYQQSRDTLMQALQEKKKIVLRQQEEKVHSGLSEALDKESISYLLRFDRETDL